MIKYHRLLFLIPMLVILLAVLLVGALPLRKVPIERYRSIARPPAIRPDYSNTVIPSNIAPLNFLIQEKAAQYCVKIHSKQGPPIEIFSRSPKIMIPAKPWRRLLSANTGESLYLDVFVKKANAQWSRFTTITNKIANDPIDKFLVYRKIHPAHSNWRDMGIYQRNLQNFDESVVLDNGYCKRACLNCHAFCANRTDRMLIGVRSRIYGNSAILAKDGAVDKIGAKFGYTSWHPSGRLAAYSINKARQFFHTARNEVRDVVDLDSALAYYLIDSQTLKTSPDISKKDRLETYPTWSPDGRYLYFSSAPMLWSDRDQVPPQHYDEVKYDLMRISYDINKDRWGQLETVLAARDTGLSILQPRISPDGRWLLFCMCDYGCFPVYQQSSDLYLMDLKPPEQTDRHKYRRLDINSDQSESWHSFSSNSRWLAFSSKKNNYVFTRIYLSYLDRQGNVYKPILMPQKDPAFYDSCLKTYSLPEFVTSPVQAKGEKLGRTVRSYDKISIPLPITMATPKDTAEPDYEDPWQQRE